MPCFKAAREQTSDYGSPDSNTEFKHKIDFKVRSKPREDAQKKISMISRFKNFSSFTMNVDLSDIHVNCNSRRRERKKIKTERRGVRTKNLLCSKILSRNISKRGGEEEKRQLEKFPELDQAMLSSNDFENARPNWRFHFLNSITSIAVINKQTS